MGLFKATIDARGVEQRFDRAVGELEREMRRTVEEIGDDAEVILAAHALRDSGRLARGIESTAAGNTAIIRSTARDPKSGFAYTNVTRFGHRKEFIRPKGRGFQAFNVATRGRRARGRAATLRFTIGGRVLYRPYVKGFRPKSDWVEDALPEIQREAERSSIRLGQRIGVRLNG